MRSEVVVVGAGVVGSSIALDLARGGYGVLVVDKAGGVGHGSTSASSAVVRFNFSTWAGVAGAWESRAAWERWDEHLGGADPAGTARYVRTGLAALDVDAAPRSTYLPFFDDAGIPYEEWDADTLARRVPGIDNGRYWPPRRIDDERFWADARSRLGAVFTPDAGYVSDPQLAAQNLATAARRHGAEFLLRRAVTGIGCRHGRTSEVRLDDGTRVSCSIVVNAAGPWSATVNALAGVGSDFTVRTRPLRQEVAHVAAPRGYNASGTAGTSLADLDLGIYVRGEVGDGMLVGGTEPECDPFDRVDSPDDVDPAPTAAVFQAQVTRAARRLPDLGVPNRARGVVGVYDVADDWTPIYDRTGLPGFYVAIGTSGNQFKNAPVVGRFMRTIIECVENGVDHDTTPARFTAPLTGATIDLGAFSRRRPVGPGGPGTVMG
ncbi:FAD-binding oxidoreductase [Pseudonocardia sp. ICBG601]|uniref:NAD(P)/FAD-dependent oxidoreductase n=1 Tax=Pseudonocardia sp. ICBG601 TaxID=2846759 RepID=UPI001CF6304D|nr:FAD-dependent oxidoreductase [Pseudonocardia sp. ICBG601]